MSLPRWFRRGGRWLGVQEREVRVDVAIEASLGFDKFPNSIELKDRLAIKDDKQLLKFVETQRSLDRPIDTDLSFLDAEPPPSSPEPPR